MPQPKSPIPADLLRYQRQIVLPEIGEAGQQRISALRVLCVGAGGLGSPAALYLAAAGVGTLGLIDDDCVDVTNLQRQILFQESDAGHPKVARAAERIRQLNSGVHVETHEERLTAENAAGLFARYDVVVDGSDNFPTKYLVNDAAAKTGTPWVYGSISRFEGQVATFVPGAGACYRCLFPEPPRTYVPNCAEAGVLGAVAGMTGSLQALEAIRFAIGQEGLRGKLWMIDTRSYESRVLQVPRRADCPICNADPASIELRATEDACGLSDSTLRADEVAQLLSSGGAIRLIDVREEDEWNSGRIPGALGWPLSRIERGEHPAIPAGAICVVYCRSGVRSLRALELLRTQSGGALKSLEGGILAWTGALA